MGHNILSQAAKFIKEKRRRQLWRKAVSVMAAVVVFFTTYALILPAITMEHETFCGLEEHTHTDACYATLPGPAQAELICTPETLGIHEHTEDCFDEHGALICGYADFVVHTHDAYCYDASGHLICTLPEIEEHIHDRSCFENIRTLICEEEESPPHTHDEDCYAQEQGVLICDQEEGDDHAHSDTCFEWTTTLTCTQDETSEGHVHTEDCYTTERIMVCEKEEIRLHTHTEECFDEHGELICKKLEIKAHQHMDECLQPISDESVEVRSLICGLDAHTHAEECYLNDGKTEKEYICNAEEHVHGESCYDENGVLTCDVPEHTHSDECLQTKIPQEYILTATTPEGVTVVLAGPGTSFTAPLSELILTVDELSLIEEAPIPAREDMDSLMDGSAVGAFSMTEEHQEEQARAVAAFETMDSAIAELDIIPETRRLFDIRLWWGEEELEPIGPVSLTFLGAGDQETTGEARVFHIDETENRATDMPAALNEDGSIEVQTDHFSLYGVALLTDISPFATGTITETMAVTNATWNPVQKQITALSFKVSGTIKNWLYTLQHSTDGGATWPTNPTTGTKAAANGSVIQFDAASLLNNLTINSVFRVYGYKDNNNRGYTADLTIYAVFNTIKPGFSSWLNDSYAEFGGVPPTTMTELNDAFAMYYAQPITTLTQELRSGSLWLDVAVTPAAAEGTEYAYHWQYQDEAGQWQELTADTTASINASALQALLAGGKQVRAKVYNDEDLAAISNQLLVDPQAEANAAAILAINAELGLTTYNIGKGKTADLSIGGHRFNDLFYYGNMARDSAVPFSDAESYRTYLAETYLTEGINAVRSEWNYYLWDLYDPSYDYGNSNGGSGAKLYPEAGGYGDSTFEWPKDKGGSKSSPFHASASPTIEPLNYNFLENGVDYSNFVTGLHKTAKAAAAGDANSERRYDIDIVADAQAKVKAPVVLVFQIQTSWQMFDIPHANRLKTDLPKNGTNVGAASHNTELANLYDIKQALLRLINYMEENDLGNNLAVAITDVEHAGAFSMFTGTDGGGKALYVTNNFDKLREGIIGWDTFGNCEHIHYDDATLRAAVTNLASNLSIWKDIYGNNLSYNNIQKAAVIIGGPTENTSGTSGYGITLPWTNFQSAGLNSVYGIRTNKGTPITAGAPISWIDYSGNNTGTAFKDGTGTKFTDKYVASNEDALFYSLLDIVNREMNTKGMNVTNGNTYVDDVTVSDTVEKEFFLNKGAAITAAIQDANGNTLSTKTLTLAGAQIDRQSNGAVVTTTVDGLVITERPDKTTTLEYNFGQVYNTRKAVLHFQVEAREDYIGSNTVFANAGTPALDYTHIKRDSGGNPIGEPNIYPVVTKDTPQVNVPIRFDTVDGEAVTIMVGEPVNLKDLSEAIALDAQDRVDNYPQTNGTLSYVWVLPNGTEVPAGSVTVIDGTVSTEFPDRSSNFTGTVAGMYTGTLKVTFTPLPVDSANTNFSDTATKTAVNPLTKPGNVWINVITGESTTDLLVRKEWADGPPAGVTAVDFLLLADGVPIQENGIDRLFNLSKENRWELLIENLPMVRDNAVIAYTVQETPVSDTYRATYDSDIIMEPVYKARVKLTVTPNEKVDAKQSLTIVYTYGGQIYTYLVAANTHAQYPSGTAQTFTVDNLPLDENGNPMAVAITEVRRNNDSKPDYTRSATSESYISTYVSHPVWIITNTPAFTLPETGGAGTIPYTMAGVLLLLCAGLMYKKKSFRKGGCKFR